MSRANHKGEKPIDITGDGRWMSMHARYKNEASNTNNCDILLIGDSIVQQFQLTKFYKECLPEDKTVLNFGIGGDKVENILWRLEDGDWLENLKPKIIVLFGGTNNVNTAPEDVVTLLEIIVDVVLKKSLCHIIIPFLLPRGQYHNRLREQNNEINRLLKTKFENCKNNIHLIDIEQGKIIENNGEISHKIMHDYLHLTERGYRITWSTVIEKCKDILMEGQ